MKTAKEERDNEEKCKRFMLMNYNCDPDNGVIRKVRDPYEGIKTSIKDHEGNDRIQLFVEGNQYLFYTHRIAWLLNYGYFPEDFIYHENGNKSDHRLDNLRIELIVD